MEWFDKEFPAIKDEPHTPYEAPASETKMAHDLKELDPQETFDFGD